MVFSTKPDHPLLSSPRQRHIYAKLRAGLFIKLSKMVFGGFFESVTSFVNGKEPDRAADLNLACLFLTPPKFAGRGTE